MSKGFYTDHALLSSGERIAEILWKPAERCKISHGSVHRVKRGRVRGVTGDSRITFADLVASKLIYRAFLPGIYGENSRKNHRILAKYPLDEWKDYVGKALFPLRTPDIASVDIDTATVKQPTALLFSGEIR